MVEKQSLNFHTLFKEQFEKLESRCRLARLNMAKFLANFTCNSDERPPTAQRRKTSYGTTKILTQENVEFDPRAPSICNLIHRDRGQHGIQSRD